MEARLAEHDISDVEVAERFKEIVEQLEAVVENASISHEELRAEAVPKEKGTQDQGYRFD